MYSVNRTIGIQATFRASACIQADVAAPSYNCDIKAGVISNGWETHMTRAGQLFLDPATAGYDNTLLLINQPRMVFARETTGTLAQNAVPPATETTTIGEPDLVVTRLDDGSDTDGLATLEFRIDQVNLLPVTGASTTDYNRVYLVANSAIVDVQTMPAAGSGGPSEPGIIHQNASGSATFDPAMDLYVLDADGGNIITDGTNQVWINREDILTDPVWNSDVVLGAIDVRNTIVDDIDYDILRGSATAVASILFRIVL